jgi:ATP-dependent protease ClpP protease subunit
MKHTILATCVLGAIFAFDNVGLDTIAPEARGKSVLALSTNSNGEAELLIYGPIGDYFWGEGITAASVVEQLSQVRAGTIHVRINSDGGVVTDGLAIYNALVQHPATVNVTVDGIAASIASLIVMAGSTRRMHANTMMMLHGPQSGAWGFAGDLRDRADVLDTYAASMQSSYGTRAKDPAAIEAMLADRKDHWFTASEAVATGLADQIVDVEQPIPSEAATAAALLSYVQAIASTPAPLVPTLRNRIQTTTTASAFSSLREGHQRAIYAHLEDSTMKQQCQLILAQAGNPGAPATTPHPAPAAAPPTAAAPVSPAPATNADDVLASLQARNTSLRGVFAGFHDIPGIRELESECLADPRMTVEQAQTKLLARMGNGAAPLAAGGVPRAESGQDERDKVLARTVQGVLARAGVLEGAAADEARQGNNAARASLISLAEDSLIRAGISTRNMTRDQIAGAVLASQTTSDFPVLLENVLHKMLLGAYRLQPFTWRRFCTTGTLADYRPHNRYHMGSFTDLKPVNEDGEYENGVLSDGAKETIQGKRRGRILQITPEVLVNDDLAAFTRPTQALGQAAGRTIEKDVYALFALNSGNGPTMSDGNPLFHASHGNIADTAGAPTIALIDGGRQKMAQQMDVGNNDYLDIVPNLFLGPLSLGSAAREINAQEYNDESNKQQRKPNVVRGIFSDVIDSVRLSGNAWYMLADPSIEPVFEVAFLDGVQEPTLEQEKNFRTDGLSWKVVHRYGVGAVGYRGIHKNAGG